MSQETLDPRQNVAGNAPAHDPTATPAPADSAPDLPLERVDLHELAGHVAATFNHDGTRVVVEGPHAVVATHPGMLRPTLRLLVEDALCSADATTAVTISIRVTGFDVDVVVTDPAIVPAEISGAGAGLAEAGPLARRLGARLELSLDGEGRSEVRVRLPRLEQTNTVLVIGSTDDVVPPHLSRIGMSALLVPTVQEALQAMLDGCRVCAALVLPGGWSGTPSRDVLAFRCALLPSPLMSVGPPPESVRSLVETALPDPVTHTALREALWSARQP